MNSRKMTLVRFGCIGNGHINKGIIQIMFMLFFIMQIGISYSQNVKKQSVKLTATTNPITIESGADLISICPETGVEVAKIFLCGSNASRLVTPLITANSITWQKLDESSCVATTNTDCPNTGSSCTWTTIDIANSKIINDAGQYRIIVINSANQVATYYFNVYKNGLSIPFTKKDVYCGAKGQIVAAQLTGYEYSKDNTNYQASNEFNNLDAGDYTITVRRTNASLTDCNFQIKTTIENKDLSLSTSIIQPTTYGQKGSVSITASGVRSPYYYKISQGATVIQEIGPVLANSNTFSNLNSGTYTLAVKTDDCDWKTTDVTINYIPPFTTTITIQPETCQKGSLMVTVTGGTAPYRCFLNGSTISQDISTNGGSTTFTNLAAGTYTVLVKDSNNLIDNVTKEIKKLAPEYTIEKENLNCYSPSSWQIKYNVTNTNGFTLRYSKDDGLTYQTSNIFPGLSATPAGSTYKMAIEYSFGTIKCVIKENVTVVQPQFGLAATAGVSELIGCNASPNDDKATVRITNPQGGTPPYQYSFDNKATWGTTSTAFMKSGSYVFYIKDSAGCIATMPSITIDPVVAPVFSVVNGSYNCDGSSNSAVNVTSGNESSYTYEYSLDGGPFQNTKNFGNISPGNHSVTVKYTPTTIASFSNLLKEDFGYGVNTTSPGMSSAYCFEQQTPTFSCGPNAYIGDGEYSVTPKFTLLSKLDAWFDFKDHTPALTPPIPNGRFLAVNIKGATSPVLYEKVINEIVPNQLIKVEFFAANLIKKGRNLQKPNLRLSIVNTSGVVVDSFISGSIPEDETWHSYSKELNPGNNTTLKFVITSIETNGSGNDLAVDDITAYQIPKLCTATKTIPFVVPTDKKFDISITSIQNVSCSGIPPDGKITISAVNYGAGFQYSIDNGTTWITSTTSPVTISNLSAGNYTVKARFNGSTNPNCLVTINLVPVTTPSPLVTSAEMTTPASCVRGATITANSTGGTPAYKFELWDNANSTKLDAQTSGIFTNVSPGTYTIRGFDANFCANPTPVKITVPVPTPVLADIKDNTVSDLCYDNQNAATLVVNVSSGTAPYSYSLNGDTAQTSNTFTNIGPGAYIVTVTDANGCHSNTQNMKIGQELNVTATLSKVLDCTSVPDAIITVNIDGGVSPFRYNVYKNGSDITKDDISIENSGTIFTYSVAEADKGKYSFEITDANGCKKMSNEISINPKVDPDFNYTTVPISCFGDLTGAINVTPDVTKGLAPYTYTVTKTPTNTSYGTQLSGLPAGVYEVKMTDSNSCFTTKTITITEPNKLQFGFDVTPIHCDSTTSGLSKGAITITSVTGGTPNYDYFLTGVNNYYNEKLNDSASYKFDVIDFGFYTLNVIDDKGCTATESNILVASPNNELEVIPSTSPINCTLGGAATVNVIGDLYSSPGPFYFALYKSGLTYPGAAWKKDLDGDKSYTFNGLLTGVKYTFVVYDESTFCYHFITAKTPIVTNSTLSLNKPTTKNISCKGSANGKVSFDITSTYAVPISVEYEVLNSQSLEPVSPAVIGTGTVPASGNGSLVVSDLGNIPYGNYIVIVKETSGVNTGCSLATESFTIEESVKELTINASVFKNANCNDYGIINVSAAGGTSPFQFQAVKITSTIPPPPPPSSDPNNWVSTGTFTVEEGDYKIFVKDSYGCEASMNLNMPKDPVIIISPTLTSACAKEGSFEIKVDKTSEGVSPYTISVNSSNYSAVSSFPVVLSNLNSGTYSITIRDVNGCGDNENIVIFRPLGIGAEIKKLPSCNSNDGEIEASSVGGSGSFEYKIDSGAFSTTKSFTGLAAGTHTITIRDTSTTCTNSINVTLEAPSPISGLTLTPRGVTCNGGNDGSIVVNMNTPTATVNNNPIYTYSLDGGTAQTSNVFSGLIAKNNYTVVVKSARGCSETKQTSVNEPTIINVPAPTVSQFGCNSSNNLNNASITVSAVTGGSGNYKQFEFKKNGVRLQFGTNPKYIEGDIAGGTYDIIVYDDNGCTGSTTATINPYIELNSIQVVSTNPINCSNNSEDIQVSVTGTGLLPSLTYGIEALSGRLLGVTISSNTTGSFTGLPSGDYKITVTNNITGCFLQTVYTVNLPNSFILLVDVVSDVVCSKTNSGSVSLTFVDQNTPSRAGTFDYIIRDKDNVLVQTGISSTAGPETITGLAAGVYSVTATLRNNPYCSLIKSFTISEPTTALTLSEKVSEISCVTGNNDGKISALPLGGWSDFYEYRWEKAGVEIQAWSNISELTNLTAGSYQYYVKDAKGCIVTNTKVLSNPTPIAITATASNPMLNCYGDKNGQIKVNIISGGQGGSYWYSLHKLTPTDVIIATQTTLQFDNLLAGDYRLTVVDNWSCIAVTPVMSISEPKDVVVNLVINTNPTCVDKPKFDLTITGGTPPYSISTDRTNFSLQQPNPIIGDFTNNRYYVKDTNGCGPYVSNDILVVAPVPLAVSVDKIFAQINCKGDKTASIIAKATGGFGNYMYSLLDTSNTEIRVGQPSGTFTNLGAGNYVVKVVSSDCTPILSNVIQITEPAAVLKPNFSQTATTCFGSSDGSISVNPTGGTVVIKQAISPNLSQFTEVTKFDNLLAGNYDVVVQDVLGCYVKQTIAVAEPPALEALTIPSSIVQEICYDDLTAAFSIVVTGGIAPYKVSLDEPDGTYTDGAVGQTRFDFSGLRGGTHNVYIKDQNNCFYVWPVYLNESVKLNPTTITNYNCVSNAQHNIVTVNLDPSITDFSLVQFSLDGGAYQSSNEFINVSQGDHFIRVRHNNGCIKETAVFNIRHFDPLTLSVKDGGLNEIIAVANGGGGNYKYTFNGESTGNSNSYIYYNTQDFTVTVEDENGCKETVKRNFIFIDICVPNYFTPNGDGVLDTWAPGCVINNKDLEFTVFDRYGREIKRFNLGGSWDGKYQGEELPTGDYWYVLKLNNPKDDREFVGHFTLYR